jgi:hypothetical protein
MSLDEMKIELAVPQWKDAMRGETARASDIVGLAQQCHEAGFDSVWAVDQILLDLADYYMIWCFVVRRR